MKSKLLKRSKHLAAIFALSLTLTSTILSTTSQAPSNQKQAMIKTLKSYFKKTKNGTHNFTRRFLGKKGYSQEEVQWARSEVTAVIATIALLVIGCWHLKPGKSNPPEDNDKNPKPSQTREDNEENTNHKDHNHEKEIDQEAVLKTLIEQRLEDFNVNKEQLKKLEELSTQNQYKQLNIWADSPLYYFWYPYEVTIKQGS